VNSRYTFRMYIGTHVLRWKRGVIYPKSEFFRKAFEK